MYVYVLLGFFFRLYIPIYIYRYTQNSIFEFHRAHQPLFSAPDVLFLDIAALLSATCRLSLAVEGYELKDEKKIERRDNNRHRPAVTLGFEHCAECNRDRGRMRRWKKDREGESRLSSCISTLVRWKFRYGGDFLRGMASPVPALNLIGCRVISRCVTSGWLVVAVVMTTSPPPPPPPPTRATSARNSSPRPTPLSAPSHISSHFPSQTTSLVTLALCSPAHSDNRCVFVCVHMRVSMSVNTTQSYSPRISAFSRNRVRKPLLISSSGRSGLRGRTYFRSFDRNP